MSKMDKTQKRPAKKVASPTQEAETPKYPVQHRMRDLRIERGLSLKDVAHMIGTSEPQMSRLEGGFREMTEGWMRKIAPALGVEPADLLEIAAFIDMEDEVQEAEESVPAPVARAMNSRDMRIMRITGRQLESLGYEPGKEVVFWCCKEAAEGMRTGDVVLVRLTRKADGASVKVVRQFVGPSILVTNKNGRNVAISLNEHRFVVEVLGVAAPA